MNETDKVLESIDVDGYKLQVVSTGSRYVEEVFFARALQESNYGVGWVEAWGTPFFPTREEAKAVLVKTWKV